MNVTKMNKPRSHSIAPTRDKTVFRTIFFLPHTMKALSSKTNGKQFTNKMKLFKKGEEQTCGDSNDDFSPKITIMKHTLFVGMLLNGGNDRPKEIGSRNYFFLVSKAEILITFMKNLKCTHKKEKKRNREKRIIRWLLCLYVSYFF